MFWRSFNFKSSHGFSLIEMLVVVSIFVIMTGIVLSNLPAFRSRSSLDLVAQEVAIIIRQAQVFGAGTRSAGPQSFPSHGVYFNDSEKRSFVFFADRDEERDYDPGSCGGATDECREVFRLSGSVEISDLPNTTTIIFERPYLEAVIKSDDDPGVSQSAAIIKLKETKSNDTRCVNVWNTGHIYVNDCSS